MSMYGTNDEERTDLTKEESKYVRARSRRLLSSLLNPIKPRIYLAILLGVISTALRVAGPALLRLVLTGRFRKQFFANTTSSG